MIGSAVWSRRLSTNINDPDSVCMSLFFGEDDLLGSRIIDLSDSSFTVKGSGENPSDLP
jgi:hypothetical protein